VRLLRRLELETALQGSPARGRVLLQQASKLLSTLNSPPTSGYLFAGLALCDALHNQPENAMCWLGVTDTILESVQFVLVVPESLEYDQTLALVKEQASPEMLTRWRARGRALTQADAIELATRE
jgi:hypothetical protein